MNHEMHTTQFSLHPKYKHLVHKSALLIMGHLLALTENNMKMKNTLPLIQLIILEKACYLQHDVIVINEPSIFILKLIKGLFFWYIVYPCIFQLFFYNHDKFVQIINSQFAKPQACQHCSYTKIVLSFNLRPKNIKNMSCNKRHIWKPPFMGLPQSEGQLTIFNRDNKVIE